MISGPPLAVDRPIHPPAAGQTAIGRVDDSIDLLQADVALDKLDPTPAFTDGNGL